MLWVDCEFSGPCGIDLAPSNLPNMNAEFRLCRVESTFVDVNAFALRSNSESLILERSTLSLSGGLSTKALDVHPDAGVHGSDLLVDVRWCRIAGDFNFDTTGVVGTTRVLLGATDYDILSITGALTEQVATIVGESLFYDNATTGIPSENVQDALDHLFGVFSVTGLGGLSLTLDTSYDGIDVTTGIPGSGNGRRILADSGAVIIQAADPPLASPLSGQTDGWLQVEGNVQVGGIGAPEVDIAPNPFGIGPHIRGGSLVYPDIAATPHRAIPVFAVRGASTGIPLHHTYNLLLETESDTDASRGEIGRVLLRGGDSLGGGVTHPKAGSVFLQSGSGFDLTGAPGDVWLSPGHNLSTGDTGKVVLTNPTTGDGSTLTAASSFVGGVAGAISFYISGVGILSASILSTDALVDVQTKLNAVQGLSCNINPINDPIAVVTVATGVNAEVYFTEDDQSGTLNAALVDFSVGGGAVFASGSWVEAIGIGSTGADELTIFGDLIVTGSLSAGSSGALYNNRKVITFADSPYTVLNTDHYIGVDSSGGLVSVTLPTTLPGSANGRELIIKDEGGVAASSNITVQIGGGALIDDVASIVLSADHSGLTIIANGQIGAATRWYLV